MTTMPITPVQGPPSVPAPRQAGPRPAAPDTAAAPPPIAPNAIAPMGPTPTGPTSGNPSERLDPGLGLIVLSLHDAAGQVTDSIPTARQLQAYRVWQAAQLGATPRPTPQALPDGVLIAGAGSPPVPPPVTEPPGSPLPAAVSPGTAGRASRSG